MKISLLSWRTWFVLITCLAVVSSLKFPSLGKQWKSAGLHHSNRQLKNAVTSISRTLKNETLIRMPIKRTGNPFSKIRQWLPAGQKKQKTLLYNSADPLHAFPNRIDLLVHSIFQELARMEVNNAATVRAALRVLRIGTIVGGVLGAVALAVGIAVPVAIARRQDDFLPDDRIDWTFVNDAAQTIIQAIESGQLRYEL